MPFSWKQDYPYPANSLAFTTIIMLVLNYDNGARRKVGQSCADILLIMANHSDISFLMIRVVDVDNNRNNLLVHLCSV